jgi:hypothetical protein
MRTEEQIRQLHDTLEEMLGLPGEVPEDVALLPKSHLTLLKWVLGYETPTTKAVEAVYKAVRESLDTYAEKKRKVPYTTEPSNN